MNKFLLQQVPCAKTPHIFLAHKMSKNKHRHSVPMTTAGLSFTGINMLLNKGTLKASRMASQLFQSCINCCLLFIIPTLQFLNSRLWLEFTRDLLYRMFWLPSTMISYSIFILKDVPALMSPDCRHITESMAFSLLLV